MKITVAAIGLLVFVCPGAMAEPLKKGRVLCEGESCGEVNDFKGRVVRRIKSTRKEEDATSVAKAAQVNRVRKKRGSDQVRISQSAPIPLARDPDTNLPAYYAGVDRHGIEASEKVVFVPQSHDPKLKGFKSGDIVWAVIEQEITASPEVPTPVRAIATSGPFKGAYFVGEATLDRELKRVLFNFKKLRIKNGDSVYGVKAAGLSPRGSIGLEGEYVSQTGKFFIAELASAAASGFVDSTINRNPTALGSYVQEPSFANSGKTAAVTALSKTTDRMAESVRSAPEYTHIQGYQEIQVMIQDDPVESGS